MFWYKREARPTVASHAESFKKYFRVVLGRRVGEEFISAMARERAGITEGPTVQPPEDGKRPPSVTVLGGDMESYYDGTVCKSASYNISGCATVQHSELQRAATLYSCTVYNYNCN